MEAINKESKFAAPVLTWAQKRSGLREKSTVGKFVRSSLQGLNHEDVLLKLETKIINYAIITADFSAVYTPRFLDMIRRS